MAAKTTSNIFGKTGSNFSEKFPMEREFGLTAKRASGCRDLPFMETQKKHWYNPLRAAAANSRTGWIPNASGLKSKMGSKSSGNRSGKPRAKGAGRPTIKFTVRHGQKLLMERQTMGMDINERREEMRK